VPRLFPLAFPVVFAGIWAGISYLMSRLSGWRSLAERYRTGGAPDGERLTWTSGQLGGVSFRSCLNLALGPSGLFIAPALPFRLFMPPLLVPWNEVRFEGFTRLFFFELACFRLGGEGPILALYRPTAERLRPRLGQAAGSAFDSGGAYAGSLIDRRMRLVAAAAAFAGLAAAVVAMKK
jgi:hypothetical protein